MLDVDTEDAKAAESFGLTVEAYRAKLADGSGLFHADHSNLGTGSALTESNLDAGMAAIEIQTENSVPLDTPARFLLVPPSERGNGRRLARAMALTDAANPTARQMGGMALALNEAGSNWPFARAPYYGPLQLLEAPLPICGGV